MLIDHIDIEKLPGIIVWLDWCVYAYWPSLMVAIFAAMVHYWFSIRQQEI